MLDVDCWLLSIRKLLASFSINHIILGLLFLLPMILHSQTRGTIQGQVTDGETGAPLVGANVIIHGTVLGSSTDGAGRFIIERIPPGAYSMHVSMMGYAAQTVDDVLVRAGETTEVSIAMSLMFYLITLFVSFFGMYFSLFPARLTTA